MPRVHPRSAPAGIPLILAALVLTLAAGAASALEPVFHDDEGIAIRGYDPVAYFTDGKPVSGDRGFRHEWNGATWLFASAEHRDRFAADPERWAPRYGGYCAWAVAHDYTAPTDPAAFTIVDGRLYLNYDLEVQEKWRQDPPRYIRQGDRNWPGLLRH